MSLQRVCALTRMLACLFTRLPLFFSLFPFPLARGTSVWSLLQLLVAMLLVSLLVSHRHRLEDHSYCKQTGTSHTPV